MAVQPLPEPLYSGLMALVAISDQDFDSLIAALHAIPIEIKQHRIFTDFDIPNFTGNADQVKSATLTLILAYAQRAGSAEEIADGVVSALKTRNMIDQQRSELLLGRVIRILDVEELKVVAKAHNVLLEHQCTFSSARIVSDIRPVFGGDVSATPDAAVIVHMLNIIYLHSRRKDSFTLALDEKDIDDLIKVLERARTKGKTLQEVINATGIKYIGVT